MEKFFEVEKVTENLWRFLGADGSTVYLFVGSQQALLLDTACGYGDLRREVAQLTDKPLCIVNTHAHSDHIGGNYQFQCPAYLHPLDAELAADTMKPENRALSLEKARQYTNYVTGVTGNILPPEFKEEKWLLADSCPYLPLSEGMVFSLGGITLRVICFPGHTKGSVGLFYEEKQWLFSGDAFGKSPWLFSKFGAGITLFKQSLEKAISLNPLLIYGGHGREGAEKESLKEVLACVNAFDYEKGIPFANEMTKGEEVRLFSLEASSMEEVYAKGTAAIVISRALAQQ